MAWNTRVRRERGIEAVAAVLGFLRGQPMRVVVNHCEHVLAQPMPTTTLEALLDAVGWRACRGVPAYADPVKARTKARRAYWERRDATPPPFDSCHSRRRCARCKAHMSFITATCPRCHFTDERLDHWNPHLRCWQSSVA